MPELPEVESVRRELLPVMRGATFLRVRLRRPDLRRPFPARFAKRLQGQRVVSLTRRGKYLVAALSTGDVLLMHLGMSGSFRVGRHLPGTPRRLRDVVVERHDHVVFEMSSGVTVTFNDPRRFGVMDLITAVDVPAGLSGMGPEPLDDAFDAVALARACARRRTPLKVALLDQSIVAGLGNIYASEALHAARLSPRRKASTLATRDGQPTASTVRLVRAIKSVLRRAVRRSARVDDGGRFRVYDRAGERCPTPGCAGIIRRITQAGRSTFYCPTCQR